MTLKESVNFFVENRKEYYRQWMFEEPIVISKSHNNKLIKVQKIMYKLIYEFVTSYFKYKHLMPLESKVEEIIKIFNEKEYKIGTYRTDFVYDYKQQVKLIEITCRFALNGMFLSQLINSVAKDFNNNQKLIDQTDNFYEPIFDHFENYLRDINSIYILKGNDTANESKIYKDIFERCGYMVNEVNYLNVEKHIDLMKNSLIISELSFNEIASFSTEVIKKLMPLRIMNDFRTIFLIHDKRFFSVIGKKELQENVLSLDEINFFKDFYIPTFTSNEENRIWKSAQKEKDKWIIKHRALGKSQKIYAGIVTENEKWNSLFSETEKQNLILQKWIPQKKIVGKIKGEVFNDFVTGTLLFFDNNYFGMGDFRTSSYPITNKVDHRKASSLIMSTDENIENTRIKNYIN